MLASIREKDNYSKWLKFARFGVESITRLLFSTKPSFSFLLKEILDEIVEFICPPEIKCGQIFVAFVRSFFDGSRQTFVTRMSRISNFRFEYYLRNYRRFIRFSLLTSPPSPIFYSDNKSLPLSFGLLNIITTRLLIYVFIL